MHRDERGDARKKVIRGAGDSELAVGRGRTRYSSRNQRAGKVSRIRADGGSGVRDSWHQIGCGDATRGVSVHGRRARGVDLPKG
jgi:hypothetical protein